MIVRASSSEYSRKSCHWVVPSQNTGSPFWSTKYLPFGLTLTGNEGSEATVLNDRAMRRISDASTGKRCFIGRPSIGCKSRDESERWVGLDLMAQYQRSCHRVPFGPTVVELSRKWCSGTLTEQGKAPGFESFASGTLPKRGELGKVQDRSW